MKHRTKASVARHATGWAILVIALAVGGCASKPPESVSGANWIDGIANAEVSGVEETGPARLTRGLYEGAPYAPGGASRPRVLLIPQTETRGDLDGRVGEEVAVLLSASSGGSGEFIYLAVFGDDDGSARNLATAPVGDRVKLRTIEISDRAIVLEVLEAGPKDAMCCPTQLARRIYQLEKGSLQQVSNEVTGTLSLASLAGPEWRLIEMDGKPLPEGAKQPTLLIDGGTAAGFSGCNRYTGKITETSPGRVALGPQAVTMMACIEPHATLEQGYLRRLAKTDAYSFLAGRLLLGWSDGDESGTLLFDR